MLHPRIERANWRLAETGRPFVCRDCGDLQPAAQDSDLDDLDARGVCLCFTCYTDAGNENEHNDGRHDDQPDPTCCYCVAADHQAKELTQ